MVVEDETRLGDELCESLERLWPKLTIIARAADGAEALDQWNRLHPDIVFLDIQMPGMSGLEVARRIGAHSHVVFVTAYDQYAVQAFEQGVVDYVLKPFEAQRLELTIGRLKDRMGQAPAPLDDLLRTLAGRLPAAPAYLRWVTASLGQELRVITSEEICFFRAEHKYTVVATADKEAIMSTPIKDLVPLLDPSGFWQIHRGTIVNIREIAGVRRDLTGQLYVQLRQRKDLLAVSARFAHQFKQM
jgi:DNA-binding LytR/AlgR family response regulator